MTHPVSATVPNTNTNTNTNPSTIVNDKRGFSLGSFGAPAGQGEIMFGSSYDQAVSGREYEKERNRVIYSGLYS